MKGLYMDLKNVDHKDVIIQGVNSIRDNVLKSFCKYVLDLHPDFFNSPASCKNHHAYKGGLAAHTYSSMLLGHPFVNACRSSGL